MTHEFKTVQEAIGAGYRRVCGGDRDVSGPNMFGYDYESTSGEHTVCVYFSEEINRMGQPGCYIPMFPPTPAPHTIKDDDHDE